MLRAVRSAVGTARTARGAVAAVGQVRSMGQVAGGHDVLCFDGDGIGPEIVQAAQTVIEATGVDIRWHKMDMGHDHAEKGGVYLSEEHLVAFETHKCLFKGPLTVPPGGKASIEMRGRVFSSGNQVFRKIFQLYANIRPAKNWEGIASPMDNVDLVCIRENTEDVYSGMESWPDEDTVHCIKVITRGASNRIAQFAVDYAEKQGRTRVTCLHKANVCKQSDGLFLSEFRKVAETAHPDLVCDDQLADSALTRLVQAPHEFDVLCCPNLFGDLVSDMAGGMIGSLGLCPSGNIGAEHALFEPAHGSAPDIAGKGIANPTSQILTGAMMLEHLGEQEAAANLKAAIGGAFKDGVVPFDLGGDADTATMVDAVISRLK